MKAEEVATKLRGKPARGGFLCHCPVPSHGQGRGDRNPSLSVADGDKGLLVKCHGGCDPQDVLAALRYEPGRSSATKSSRIDTFGFETTSPAPEGVKQYRRFSDDSLRREGYQDVATYNYTTREGEVLSQKLRYEHATKEKTFRQRSPDGNGGWWADAGTRKVPYRWHEFAKFGHTTMYVCEGEKDVDRLMSLGILATTVDGTWSQESIEALKGYDCFILEDNDKTGREKAIKAAEALYGIAARVCVVRIPGLGPREDVSDWLDQGSEISRLHDIAAAAPEWRPENEPAIEEAPDQPEGLPFKAFDDLVVNVQKPAIMKGVLARRETSSWIGSPGAGKSGLTTDLFVHVAAGLDWRGYRSKERCAVVVLAFERVDQLERRLEAYRRKHGFKGLPIAIVKAPVDLMRPESVTILTSTIRSVERRFNLRVGVLGIDTFAKAIALGGGDENSAKDQNRVLGHLRLVQNATDVHVALVGHTGKDETKGARGSNAHLGDVDLMVQFSGDLVKSAVITKANDQPEGPLTTFRLETYDFGIDEDGDPITTSIVAEEVPQREAKSPQKRALTDRQKIALDALTEALISFGREAPFTFQLPKNIRAVESSKWRDELFKRGALDRDAPNPRKEFARIRDALISKGLIGFREDLAWKVDS